MPAIKWLKKRVAGISAPELGAVILFYGLMVTAYYVTLIFNSRSYLKPGQPIWATESFARILMDYGWKLLLTIPIWLLIFRWAGNLALWKRTLIHIFTLPFFVWSWQSGFYFLCEIFGYGRLRGDGAVWDIYIPALFYILQFSLFHVYDYYQRLQKQERISAELKQLALQSEMIILKAQIQPHFLFNTLNSISAGLPDAEEHTRELIARLADTFRFAMNTAQKEQITLQEELEFIQNYLCLEEARFHDRLKVVYKIDPAALDVLVPPFLLQPLVENALKHGIGKSMEGGTISISVTAVNNKVEFRIDDTGAGINGFSRTDLLVKGIGLQNTGRRLLTLYNEEINIVSNSPRGTSVYFSIPFFSKSEWIKN